MRCNRCGYEFGDGDVCQHCGADKVTALGEFSGYSTPRNRSNFTNDSLSPNTPPIVSDSFMICWKCGEVIPADSNYCPICQVQLFVSCPKCGHKYSAQYPNCNECGTNRERFLKEEAEAKKKAELERLKKKEEARRRQELEKILLAEQKKIEESRAQLAYEKLRGEQKSWTEHFVASERSAIINYGKRLNEDNSLANHNSESLFRLAIVFYILAGIVFLVAPCFSGTDYHSFAVVGFCFIFPGFLIFAIVCHVRSNSSDGFVNVEKSIRDFILNSYFNSFGKPLNTISAEQLDQILSNNGLNVKNGVFEYTEPKTSTNKGANQGSSIPRSQNSPSPSKSDFEQPKPNDPVYEKTIVFAQKMVADLQTLPGQFGSRNLVDKQAILERYVADHMPSNPAVSKIIDTLISDEDYWSEYRCLDMNHIGNYISKIFNKKT